MEIYERKAEKFYTTGEFARYFGIKKDTLFYYDRIGLFSPAGVHENGYRYYTSSQIARLGTILSLREMHVPLAEIRRYFQNMSPETFCKMAAEQMQRLSAEIGRLCEIRRLFAQNLQRLEEAGSARFDCVQIVQLERMPVVYSEKNPAPGDTSDARWWEIYAQFVRTTSALGAECIGSVVALSDLRAGRFGRVDRLFMPSGASGGEVRPAGTYGVYYHKGPYSDLAAVYPAMLRGLAEAGYRPGGDVYEDYLSGSLMAEEARDCVTRLTVAVQKTAE